MPELIEAELVYAIVGAFYDVYNFFGPGLPERIYSAALELELIARGHEVVRELAVPFHYKNGEYLGRVRLDMVVDSRVIVENKASERLRADFEAPLISYLKGSPFEVGVFLHFGPKPKFYRFIDFPKRHVNRIRSNSRDSCPENVMPFSDAEAALPEELSEG
jgi:GxxExxY protein